MSEVFLLDLILLAMVVVCGIAVIQINSLFAATMLAGLYSLLMAMVWSNMHALDVGFTEASVGAGISTVLLLGALTCTGRRAAGKDLAMNWTALAICVVVGGLLVYGTLDMPRFGDPDAPIHHRRVPELLDQTVGKLPGRPPLGAGPSDPHHPHPHDDYNGHVPNTVTTLLAAYRGYDTMFETTVIFTAGITMVMLIRRREDEEPTVQTETRVDEDAIAPPGPVSRGAVSPGTVPPSMVSTVKAAPLGSGASSATDDAPTAEDEDHTPKGAET